MATTSYIVVWWQELKLYTFGERNINGTCQLLALDSSVQKGLSSPKVY